MNKLLATLVLSAGMAAIAPLAMAQTADAPASHARTFHRHAALKPTERVEARLAYLRTALKITDAQQSQWNAFADVLRKHARQMEEFRAARVAQRGEAAPQPLTAIDRLERREKMMTLASHRLEEVVAAAKPLYAALSPEQRKIADDMLARQAHARAFRHHGAHRGA